MLAAEALPVTLLDKIRTNKKCSLSAATAREPLSTLTRADERQEFRFVDLQLAFAMPKPEYAAVVEQSPIHMHCTLLEEVSLDGGAAMILLTIDTFVVDSSVLSPPSPAMAGRDTKAKIDAELIRPWLGFGNRRFGLLAELRSMPRPQRDEKQWTSTNLEPNPPPTSGGHHPTMEWTYAKDGRACTLGYNPVTALIMPRPIGWISTYRKEGRILHLAPYSFFTHVGIDTPYVAFCGYRKDGTIKKDAQQDAEDMGAFCYNMVTEDLAVAMNYSAAELGREESEFELANLASEPARVVDAPMVRDAKVKFECTYVQTVNVDSWSIVIGKVVGVHIDSQAVCDGELDPQQLRPITRLGYMDEYGLLAK